MMKKLFFLFFLASALYATEYAPWFSPLWEFEGGASYTYSHTERVQSPAGSFKFINNYHDLFGSLGMTIWPNLHVEGELGFVCSDSIPFSYELFSCTVRKLLLDDLFGDWMSATIGATLVLPATRLLKDFNYPYHGYVNAELHVALGKEFAALCAEDWAWRLWGLFGAGIAERGTPWLHGLVTFDQSLSRCTKLTLFLEALYGLGKKDIDPFIPFEGYALIHHQTIDIGGALHYHMGVYATLTLLGFVNVYAHNFTEHTFGCNLTIFIPFGI